MHTNAHLHTQIHDDGTFLPSISTPTDFFYTYIVVDPSGEVHLRDPKRVNALEERKYGTEIVQKSA